MTVSYTSKIATVRFQTLWKLLLRWRGSIYKVVWKDFLIFSSLYYILSFIYRFWLDDPKRREFEKWSQYFDQQSELIPVAFVLGFYVNIVVNRWWAQVNDCLPWPDNLCISVSTHIHGNDEHGRLMRRTVVRYMNLSWILALSSISPAVKKRFPTLDHLVEMGVMTKNEKEIYEHIKTQSNKYYIPIIWASTLIKRARKENRLTNDYALVTMIADLCKFRSSLGSLFNYDWMSIPLVYTQVVTIAVQGYFLSALLGRQFLDPAQQLQGNTVDLFVPVFTFLQFLVYMGWLKVAESLINPFGEDDDDFETNAIIDRNLQVSFLIVDDMHSEHPTLIKDQYWDDIDFQLPYTAASEQYKVQPFQGSAAFLEVKENEGQLVMPTIDEEAPISGRHHMRIMGNFNSASDNKVTKGKVRSEKPSTTRLRKSLWSGQHIPEVPQEQAGGSTLMYNLYSSAAGLRTEAAGLPAPADATTDTVHATSLPIAGKTYIADDTQWAATQVPMDDQGNYSPVKEDENKYTRIGSRGIFEARNTSNNAVPFYPGSLVLQRKHDFADHYQGQCGERAVEPAQPSRAAHGSVTQANLGDESSLTPAAIMGGNLEALSVHEVSHLQSDDVDRVADNGAHATASENTLSVLGPVCAAKKSRSAWQRLRLFFKRKKKTARSLSPRSGMAASAVGQNPPKRNRQSC